MLFATFKYFGSFGENKLGKIYLGMDDFRWLIVDRISLDDEIISFFLSLRMCFDHV